jgi:hypothetical protein
MLRLFKKDKIKFYCSLPEVKEKYPIVQSKDINFKWFRKSALAYKEKSKETLSVSGTAKCPGIHNITSEGYILRSWFDMSIKTTDDPNNFRFLVPPQIQYYLREKNFNKDLIKWFSGDDPSMSIPLPDHSLKTLIKITMPWAVYIPKNWSLLIMPIPYPDEPEFTCTHGILPSGNFHEIHPIISWHKKQGELLIKAGTPLCQLIPIYNKKIDVDVLDYDDFARKEEAKWAFNMSHTFKRIYD